MFSCITPKTPAEFEQYYHFRYLLLRQPWQQAKGSEQDELETVSFHRMLVDDKGQIVAIGRLHLVSQHQAQVRYVAVSTKHQGQGLGKQLMTELEQLAAKLGVTPLNLNARANALAFYQALGYQNLGFSHCLYDQIDHYAMSKSLSSATPTHLQVLTQTLVSTWHQTIPMSQAMALDISFYNNQQLVTGCEQSFNKNLHNTMFAGSIYTHATLTGWGWVYLQLEQQQLSGDIVLADGHIRYHAPVKQQAYAQVLDVDVNGALTPLTQGKKAKLSITVTVHCGDAKCATFTGLYVILPEQHNNN